MNLFYASDKQRQLHMLKQKRFKNILLYNLAESDRKKKQRENVVTQTRVNASITNQEALHALLVDREKELKRRRNQRMVLQESYDRQIKERQIQKKTQKEIDKHYYQALRDHGDYQEEKRMVDLAKMYNRVTYNAVPSDIRYQSRYQSRRIKTEGLQEQSMSNRNRLRIKTQQQQRPSSMQPRQFEYRQQRIPSEQYSKNYNTLTSKQTPPQIRDSLDDLNIQSIKYPQKAVDN